MVEGVVPIQPGLTGGLSFIIEDDYYINNLFIVESGRVRAIEVVSGWLSDPSETSLLFAADWQTYSLAQVLQRYGQPQQVFLSLGGGSFGLLYHLILLYSDRGIAVSYQGLADSEGGTIRACPRLGKVWHIYLWLQSPEDRTPLLNRVFANPEDLVSFRTLKEVTGMGMETFYETFKNPDSGVCLEGLPP
ncbi:MAG: hypothetical protein ACP5Q1_12520 [Anaerolineae bacterium]